MAKSLGLQIYEEMLKDLKKECDEQVANGELSEEDAAFRFDMVKDEIIESIPEELFTSLNNNNSTKENIQMKTKINQIFLNLQGITIRPEFSCLSNGHGYYAYVCTTDAFIKDLFRNISMWSGSTDTHETIEGLYYSQFELDCRDKTFFKSDSFKKICQRHNIELIIFDDNSDKQIIIDFWNQMKHK